MKAKAEIVKFFKGIICFRPLILTANLWRSETKPIAHERGKDLGYGIRACLDESHKTAEQNQPGNSVKTYLWIATAVLFVSTLLAGCKPRSEKEGDRTPALTLSSEGASPGMVVRVTTAQSAFPDATAARVDIGGQRATVAKWISTTEVDVLVPNVPAGESQVKVTGGKVSEAAPFTVLPASSQELVLQLKEGRFELVAVYPTADEPNMVTRSQEPQLSYDLINAQGGLVFTGSIDHPAQARMELFDGPNAREAIIRREPPHPALPVVFALKVPVVPRGATVKLFEAQPDANLLDAAVRQNRRPVGEIKLEK